MHRPISAKARFAMRMFVTFCMCLFLITTYITILLPVMPIRMTMMYKVSTKPLHMGSRKISYSEWSKVMLYIFMISSSVMTLHALILLIFHSHGNAIWAIVPVSAAYISATQCTHTYVKLSCTHAPISTVLGGGPCIMSR